MKIHSLGKMLWLVVLLAFVVSCSGFPFKTKKPEEPPPEPGTPAPSTTGGPVAPPSQPTPATKPKTPSPSPTPPPPPPEALKESYYTHTVKWSGETLSIVAAWYTGDLQNYKALAEVMKQTSPNADINRVYVGDKILIPERLLKTRDPITKEFVDSFYGRSPKTEKGPPKRPQTEEEEPKLFGPK